MAENLEDGARARLELLRARSEESGERLRDARAELDARHPDPSSLDPDEWATALGATQHVATARAGLTALRVEQDRIRTRLAGVVNPGDTDTFEGELRAALVSDAALRVQLRFGTERVAAAQTRLALLGDLVGEAASAVAVGEAELKLAIRRQADGDALREALGEPPLDTLVADAVAKTGAPTAAARDRLAVLVPDPLRSRAVARALEAETWRDEAVAHDGAGATQVAATGDSAPLATAVERAALAYDTAEAALHGYVHSARADLDDAAATVAVVAALPDLSPVQQATLDPASRVEAVTAAEAEGALAAAVAARDVAQRAVDDAVLDALTGDPDADPFGEAAVVAAVAARDDAAVQDPLTRARGDYDVAARAALDAWEVEVPPALWQGLLDLAVAERTLDRLADQAARDALVADLDAAQDALAAALAARDRQVRTALAVAARASERTGDATAATATAIDRHAQYLQGDGPGGRVPAQL